MIWKKTGHPISERYAFAALLTVVGGFLDAYTYLTRGHVFATAQTGNIVLMGLNLANGQLGMVLFCSIPVLAYAVGVIAAEFLRSRLGTHPRLHWRQVVLGVECLLLLGAAFLPSGVANPVVNVAVSFISALQMQSFRLVHGTTFTTTMCTGNLRSGSEELAAYLRSRDKHALLRAWQYYTLILFFVLGAVLSAALTHMFAERSVLFCLLLLVVAIAALTWECKPDAPNIGKSPAQLP